MASLESNSTVPRLCVQFSQGSILHEIFWVVTEMNNTTVCVSTDNDEDEDVDNDDDDDGGKECSFKDFEGKTKEDEHGKGEEEGMLIVEYDELMSIIVLSWARGTMKTTLSFLLIQMLAEKMSPLHDSRCVYLTKSSVEYLFCITRGWWVKTNNNNFIDPYIWQKLN